MSSPTALEKGSLILVTGANGYLASHIVDQTLAAGYRVRGTVRSIEKADWLKALFSKKYGDGAFEAVEVKDMASENAFHHVMDDVSGVVHAASDLSFSPNPDEVVPLVVAGAVNVLRAAAHHPNVKRFVYTSSSSATSIPKHGVKLDITKDTWNTESLELIKVDPNSEAAKDPAMGYYVYCASKTLAEQKCWEFVKEEKPGFVLNAVLPNFNIGTILHKSQPGSSAGMIKGMWHNNAEAMAALSGIGPQWWINVQDIGRLHLAGLIYDDIKNERILGFAGPLYINKVLDVMHSVDPARKLPDPIPNEPENLTTVNLDRTVEILKKFGKGFADFEQSIKDTVAEA